MTRRAPSLGSRQDALNRRRLIWLKQDKSQAKQKPEQSSQRVVVALLPWAATTWAYWAATPTKISKPFGNASVWLTRLRINLPNGQSMTPDSLPIPTRMPIGHIQRPGHRIGWKLLQQTVILSHSKAPRWQWTSI